MKRRAKEAEVGNGGSNPQAGLSSVRALQVRLNQTPVPGTLRINRAVRPSRVNLKIPVEVAWAGGHSSGFSDNVSDGGVFVAVLDVPAIGELVDVSLTLPQGLTIEAGGTVRWIRALDDRRSALFPGLGVQFTRLSEPSRQALRRLLEP